MKRKNTSPETPAAKKSQPPPAKDSPGSYSYVDGNISEEEPLPEKSFEDKVKEAVNVFAKAVQQTIEEHLRSEK